MLAIRKGSFKCLLLFSATRGAGIEDMRGKTPLLISRRSRGTNVPVSRYWYKLNEVFLSVYEGGTVSKRNGVCEYPEEA